MLGQGADAMGREVVHARTPRQADRVGRPDTSLEQRVDPPGRESHDHDIVPGMPLTRSLLGRSPLLRDSSSNSARGRGVAKAWITRRGGRLNRWVCFCCAFSDARRTACRPIPCAAPADRGRHLPDQRHRLHRVLRRQREAGGHYYRSAFGFQLVGYRGPETGVRDRASYLLQQDKIRFVLTTPIRPDLSRGVAADRRARPPARRRRAGHRALGGRCARRLRQGGRARRRSRRRSRACSRTTTARSSSPRSASTATRSTRWSSGGTTAAVHAGLPAGASRTISRRPVGLKYVDHCVGNVELGQDERLGRVLRRRDGLPEPAHVRRQGHLHRVLAR